MLSEKPWIKEALLYKKTDNKKVVCGTCARHCIIPQDGLGFCKTRQNIDGKLYTLEYGLSSAIVANPIEKKPFFHFWPGSNCLTIGSWSCTFTCPWCLNWDISKYPPDEEKSRFVSPEDFIKTMKKEGCIGSSISFNEPTLLLEYSLDVFKLAKKEGYYNTFVSNGYMSLEALKLLVESGLDGMCINVKGSKEAVRKYCGADVTHVWKICRKAFDLGVHIEIVTLVIPTVNDDEKTLNGIAKKIVRINDEIPWHVTRYHPEYKFTVPATPVETLEFARNIGVSAGLKFVYLGNVPGHKFENTYCPKCGELLIERSVFDIISYRIIDKKCPKCKEKIPIVGEFSSFKF